MCLVRSCLKFVHCKSSAAMRLPYLQALQLHVAVLQHGRAGVTPRGGRHICRQQPQQARDYCCIGAQQRLRRNLRERLRSLRREHCGALLCWLEAAETLEKPQSSNLNCLQNCDCQKANGPNFQSAACSGADS